MEYSTLDFLSQLDSEQLKAVEHLRGPVCIIAGAGTGKTRTITHRIANGVHTGAYSASHILALTFTTRAAAQLRSRLDRLGIFSIAARTFHAAALAQLNFFLPKITGNKAPRILSSKSKFLAAIVQSCGIDLDASVLRDIAAEIEWRKVSGLTIAQYQEHIDLRVLPGRIDQEQILQVQQRYEDEKDRVGLLDFEDVLLGCAGLLEQHKDIQEVVAQRYRIFVVDEYQDVSPIQQRLLDLWLNGRDDLCVVGDPHQTIYGFAGAKSKYLTSFSERFPQALVVYLQNNYRSQAPILEAANTVVSSLKHSKLLFSTKKDLHAAAVRSEGYANDMAEARAVAEDIAQRIREGVRAQDIAILYRFHAQSALFEQALNREKISSHIHGGKKFIEHPEVRSVLIALRSMSFSRMEKPLFEIVSDVLRSFGWTQNPPEGSGALRSKWEILNVFMTYVDQIPSETTVSEFVAYFFEEDSGDSERFFPSVTLSSVHAAKGLEWKHVYLIGASEGLFPISYALTQEAIDEERRLFYVALTRAQERLSITWSNAAKGIGGGSKRIPSRFLEGIK